MEHRATVGYTSLAFRSADEMRLRTASRRPGRSQKGRSIMPKPFKLSSTRPLPPDAEIVDHEGKPHARLKWRGRTALFPLTKDGRNFLRPSKCWYFKYRDQHGTVRRIMGFSDLQATEQLAAETVRKSERMQSGHSDPAEAHARRMLTEHLKDYAAALEGKGSGADHIDLTVGRIAALVSGCGFVYPMDADVGKATEWLNALRRNATAAELPSGDSFTPTEAAEIMGISGAAVRAAIKRQNLIATGNGKARTLPRSTVEALVLNRTKGCGPETANHYTRAVRGFFRWLVKARRLGSNPLDTLTLLNTSTDIRRARRELTAGELARLFVAARESGKSFRGLTGADRYYLYLVAAGTGFRANALANLTPGDFALDAQTPIVTLAARFNKSRKLKIQPLPPDVANALLDHLTGRPTNAHIWGGTWASGKRGAEMIRIDLEAAGIAYSVEGPDGPEYADFHSLRHSYLTLGGRSGIDLHTLQELAGPSKPELTARYSHRRLYDLAGAVGMLPNLVPPTRTLHDSEIPHRMTGTDGVAGVPPGVPTGGAERHLAASGRILSVQGGAEMQRGKSSPTPEKQASRHLSAPARIDPHERGRRGSNPQPPERQSGALTN